MNTLAGLTLAEPGINIAACAWSSSLVEEIPSFEARGLEAFTFRKGGEVIETGYRAAPEEALEDPQVMARWARSAYDAALRKAARPRGRLKSKKP